MHTGLNMSSCDISPRCYPPPLPLIILNIPSRLYILYIEFFPVAVFQFVFYLFFFFFLITYLMYKFNSLLIYIIKLGEKKKS